MRSHSPIQLSTPVVRARLSLTPLIDVVFILLLFFMLASQLQRHGVYTVSLPSAVTDPQALDTPALVVIVTKSGAYRLTEDGRSSGYATLDALLAAPELAAVVDTDVMITVAGESEVSLQNLISVMDALARAGFSQRSLAAEAVQ